MISEFLKFSFPLFFLLILIGCSEETMDDPPMNPDYVIGKNYYTTISNGDTREYFVHVPSIYNPDNPTPVVFMLHGTTGFGERFYNISGWKELGEIENIITVYPSSWQYCFIDDGVTKNTTRWNVVTNVYCQGVVPKDDISFLRLVVDELKGRFNVDSKRIYLSGFSNGGSMAGRCAVEMSDIFAAIVEAAGTLPIDTTFIPQRQLPIYFTLGNSDDVWLGNASADIEMSTFPVLLATNDFFKGMVNTHASTFGYEINFTLEGDTSTYLVATYPPTTPSPPREFKFVLIRGLEHNYPNGSNHPFPGAEKHWEWMKQYSLP